jgi:hypothetical protein
MIYSGGDDLTESERGASSALSSSPVVVTVHLWCKKPDEEKKNEETRAGTQRGIKGARAAASSFVARRPSEGVERKERRERRD